MPLRSVWIGFDNRDVASYVVARASIQKHLPPAVPIHGIVLDQLIADGSYRRETRRVNGRLHDVISDAPMSTQFAISRFFVPELVRRGSGGGWAMFCDSDVMCRRPLTELFEYVEQWSDKALFCVHHEHEVREGEYKMNKQVQTNYARKNWSSVMLFNCDHPANDKVDLALLNSVPGRDLHRFCWLEDHQIGALDPAWNYLVGVEGQDPTCDPAIAHFTLGSPCLDEYKDVQFADEWHSILANWAEP